MAWRWLLALAMLPLATACSESPNSPTYAVTAVIEEGGQVTELQTGLVVKPGGCSPVGLPSLMFDGRYVAWLAAGGVQVTDLEGTQRHVAVPVGHSGVLDEGLLVVTGYRASSNLEVIDLVRDARQTIMAPEGWVFHPPTSSAALVLPANLSRNPPSATFTSFRIQDLKTAAWITPEISTSGPGWPQGTLRNLVYNRDWVVFDASGQVWAYRVANGTLHGPLQLGGSSSPPPPSVQGLRQDLMLVSQRFGNDGIGWRSNWWSVRLPEGEIGGHPGDRLTVGNRTAYMRQESEPLAKETVTETLSSATETATSTATYTHLETSPVKSSGAGAAGLAALAVAALVGRASDLKTGRAALGGQAASSAPRRPRQRRRT